MKKYVSFEIKQREVGKINEKIMEKNMKITNKLGSSKLYKKLC